MIKSILNVCRTIKSLRSVHTIFCHLESEVEELKVEVYCDPDEESGEDGVIGEAVDVMLCAVDIMYKHKPDITEEEIQQVVNRKLAKWQRVYGEK